MPKMRFSASPTSKMTSRSQVKKVNFFTILAPWDPPSGFEGHEGGIMDFGFFDTLNDPELGVNSTPQAQTSQVSPTF